MSYFYAQRSVNEDRDLSRAAFERYLMAQASSERTPPAYPQSPNRITSWLLRPARALRTWRVARGSAAGQPAQGLPRG